TKAISSSLMSGEDSWIIELRLPPFMTLQGAAAERIVILCAGRHGAIVADILQCMCDTGANVVPVGFLDDPLPIGADVLGLTVLGPIASLPDIPHDSVIVTIGDNRTRGIITETVVSAGEHLATAIHPRACVARSASVGEGSMICAGAVISPRA